MNKLIFGAALPYTMIIIVSLLVFFCYFQKMLQLKRELQNKASESNKYLRYKIMIWSSLILLVIFISLLILLIALNIK